MTATRRRAAAVGACYLVTHVTSIAALALYTPVLNDAGWVTGPGPDTRILLGALFEVVLALAVVGTAVLLLPAVRRHGESAAAGYVALRTLEAAVITVGVVALLAVVTLRQHPPAPGDTTTVARALVAVHDWTFLVGPNFVLGTNTILAAYLMLRSGLVPRAVAVLGLVGGPLILASAVAVLFGAYRQVSAAGSLTAVPVFAWELSLALYLLLRGFRPAAEPALNSLNTADGAGQDAAPALR
ncbi:DUF4386 domain-containing protein [Kitasatospora sp. NPDC048365]|uniref:DUF4386 domain-containing protein n=1 Tax=Kitasatospora sp. NPDC048365 TaxID=3364050 RepID=UPI0037153C85